MLVNEQLWEQPLLHHEIATSHPFWVPATHQNVAFQMADLTAERRKLVTKRLFDVVICLLLLPVVLPVMAVVALAIRLDSKGSIIFHQTRIGRHGEPFICLKFRSMYADAEEIKQQLLEQNEADGPVFKMKRDPRITKVGSLIRKLSLDELPQVFNVIRGDMSLVGPRPAVPSEVMQYTDMQMRRLDAIPGLTGLQQVSGRSDLDFESWVAYDLQYINEQSVLTDIKILLRTVPAVVTGKGAY
jgi:exopolysaccharide biosynthesis polyprenyl glycosylphosphotransferase